MKKSIVKLLGIIILVKVVLIAGGILAFFLYKHFSAQVDSETEEESLDSES